MKIQCFYLKLKHVATKAPAYNKIPDYRVAVFITLPGLGKKVTNK